MSTNKRDGAYQPGLKEWLKGQKKRGQARTAGMSVAHSPGMCLKSEGERMQYKELGKLQGKGKGEETKERENSLAPDLPYSHIYHIQIYHIVIYDF